MHDLPWRKLRASLYAPAQSNRAKFCSKSPHLRIHTDMVKSSKVHEGYCEKIYVDSMGQRAFGIGHKIHPQNTEHDTVAYPCGTAVLQQRVLEAFEKDWETHVEKDCFKLFPDFDCLPDFVQLVVGDMMFHNGSGRWVYTLDIYARGLD